MVPPDNSTYSYDIALSQDYNEYTTSATNFLSDPGSARAIFSELSENTVKQIRTFAKGSDVNGSNNIVEIEVLGCVQYVASTIELDDWYLSIPVDEQFNSKAQSISETTLAQGYFNSEFFLLNPQGGIVFRSPSKVQEPQQIPNTLEQNFEKCSDMAIQVLKLRV